MPATPPLTFEKSVAPVEEITPTGGLSHFAGTGTGFTQRYDKLVIAVGAYAQSKLVAMDNVERMLIRIKTSLQRARCQSPRTFPKRC